MIQQIGRQADESLWSRISAESFENGYFYKEVRATASWTSGQKDFQVFAHGTDDRGPIQFWAGRLAELTRGDKTYDRLVGSSKRISVEDVTQQFMESLSIVK